MRREDEEQRQSLIEDLKQRAVRKGYIMLSKQQRNGEEAGKQQEMSDEVKVEEKAQVSGSARGEERWKGHLMMQGHVDRGVDTR